MKTYLESKAGNDTKQKDDMVYKLTRKILVACYQHMVYNEYLPIVLGTDFMEEYDLWNRQDEESQYDESVDPTLTNEFSAFAYR